MVRKHTTFPQFLCSPVVLARYSTTFHQNSKCPYQLFLADGLATYFSKETEAVRRDLPPLYPPPFLSVYCLLYSLPYHYGCTLSSCLRQPFLHTTPSRHLLQHRSLEISLPHSCINSCPLQPCYSSSHLKTTCPRCHSLYLLL